MISNDYFGHFRGVSLLTFFLIEPLFLSYGTNKLQKKRFFVFSYHLNSMIFFAIFIFCKLLSELRQSKRGTISYIFFNCLSAGQKTLFLQKQVFWPSPKQFFKTIL